MPLDAVPLQWPITGKSSSNIRSSSPEFEQVRFPLLLPIRIEFAQIQLHPCIESVLLLEEGSIELNLGLLVVSIWGQSDLIEIRLL